MAVRRMAQQAAKRKAKAVRQSGRKTQRVAKHAITVQGGSMPTKLVTSSKTFWVNVIVGLGMILTATDVLHVIPPAALGYVAALNAVLNIILRVWFTDTSIASRQSASTPPAGS